MTGRDAIQRLAPARVIEGWIERDRVLPERRLRWRNDDLSAIPDPIRRQPEPVVDLQSGSEASALAGSRGSSLDRERRGLGRTVTARRGGPGRR